MAAALARRRPRARDVGMALPSNNDDEVGTLDQAVSVAVISASADKLMGKLRDERCWSGWPGSILPDGDFDVPGKLEQPIRFGEWLQVVQRIR